MKLKINDELSLKFELAETHDGDVRLWVTATRADGMPAYGITCAILALRKDGYIVRYNMNNSDPIMRRQFQLNHEGKIFIDADIY